MDDPLTEFDYLLNAFEQASQAPKPHLMGYGDKRQALYAYVRKLENAALAEPAVHLPDLGIAQGHVAVPASSVENTGGWISVAERLPAANVPCLVAWDGSNAFKKPKVLNEACAREEDADGWLWYEVDFGDHCEWDTDEVPTHWMPWPAAPAGPSKPGQGAGDKKQDNK